MDFLEQLLPAAHAASADFYVVSHSLPRVSRGPTQGHEYDSRYGWLTHANLEAPSPVVLPARLEPPSGAH